MNSYLAQWVLGAGCTCGYSLDPGFDPLARQGERRAVFLSLRVDSFADLFVPDPAPFAGTARTHICAHVNDPISICRKRAGLTAGGMVTHKNTAYTRLVMNSVLR